MPDITLEQIQEKFDSLPENLRLAIIVAGADKKVNTIGREHGLNIKQISELLLRTHVVMFGFVHPDKLEDLVHDITKIPPQVVKGITRDINEQIIKDIKKDLINLAERPESAKEVETFIGESTPGGKSMTPEELTKETAPLALPIPIEEDTIKKEENILKSTGIEIPVLESNKEIEKNILLVDQEISKQNKEEKEQTRDKEGDKILKSAGIEIPSLTFGNEISTTSSSEIKPAETKPIEKEPVVTKEEAAPVVKEEEQPAVIKEEKENAEIMKIAFTDLQKEETIKPKEEAKLSGIYSTVIPDSETQTTTEIPKKIEIQKEEKGVEKIIETKPEEKIDIPEKKTEDIVLQKIPTKPDEIKPVETKPIEKESVVTKEEAATIVKEEVTPVVKEEEQPAVIKEEKETSVEQSPEEIKKNADLKVAVKNIIDKYQNKQKETPSYANKEDEKRAIVMQIVEVQDGIKKMKDRVNQITKEKIKLEKQKHAFAGKGDTKGTKEAGDELALLTREEKMIQVLRESILPKEYLDLLVQLDKLSANNPPQDSHK